MSLSCSDALAEVYVKDHLPQLLYEAGIINRDLYTYYLLDKKIVQLEESIKNQFYNLERRIQQIDEKIDQRAGKHTH